MYLYFIEESSSEISVTNKTFAFFIFMTLFYAIVIALTKKSKTKEQRLKRLKETIDRLRPLLGEDTNKIVGLINKGLILVMIILPIALVSGRIYQLGLMNGSDLFLSTGIIIIYRSWLTVENFASIMEECSK